MKKILRNIAIGVALLGSLTSCSFDKKPNEYQVNQQTPLTRTEKLNQTSWSVVDNDNDGTFDELITPHRNSYYGSKGPLYVRGEDFPGETALNFAKELVTYKNKFSKMAGKEGEFYWLCRVDDFDEDGSADRISWPRKGKDMPVYEKPFPKEIQEKADKVVLFENYILDYVRKSK